MYRALVSLTCFIGTAFGAQAQQATSPINIGSRVQQPGPSIVNPVGTALQINAITSTTDDFVHSVVVTNTGNQTIVGFKIGMIMSVPKQCGPSEFNSPEVILREDRTSIAPGKQETRFDYGVRPQSFLSFREQHSATVVRAQMAVVQISFADGSQWNLPTPSKTFDDARLETDGELSCSMSSKAVLARAKLKCNVQISPDANGGNYFTCGNASSQICANSGDAKSCTTYFCSDEPGSGCPNQNCVGVIVPPTPGH